MLALDDVYPPAATYEKLQSSILDAVDALGLEIKTLDIEDDDEHITGIALYDPEQDCEVMRFDSFLFELEVLTFLRWLVVSKGLEEDDLKNVTKVGLAEAFITSAQDVCSERFDFSNGAERQSVKCKPVDIKNTVTQENVKMVSHSPLMHATSSATGIWKMFSCAMRKSRTFTEWGIFCIPMRGTEGIRHK